MRTIYVASDHAGRELKEYLKKGIEKKGYEITDFGTHSEEPVDYPDYAKKVCVKVKETGAVGLLVCGTGQGMSMSANKFVGIRAALCWNIKSAKLSREHNHANVLCMGARMLKKAEAVRIVSAFLSAKNSKEKRHLRRVKKIG
jgi:ribose 5-phosphate isomerase B